MATGDIEITSVPDGSEVGSVPLGDPGTAISTYVAQRTFPKTSPLAPKEREPLVKSTLRKRWWMLVLCALVSAAVAAFVAFRLKTQSFEIEGKMEYKGLPEMTKTRAWNPEAVETHAELLQSPTYLTTVIEKRNLGTELDVMGLQNALTVTPDSRSKIITLMLTWDDLPKGVEVLNDLMRMYVDRVVEDRRLTAAEHVKHAEEELFRAEANEDNCRKLFRNFNEKMGMTPFDQQQIPETLKQYTSALNGTEILVTDLETRIKEIEASRVQQTNELKKKMLDAKINGVKSRIERYERDSQPYAQLHAVLEELQALAGKSASFDTIPKWKEAIDAPGKNLAMVSAWINQYGSKELEDQGLQIDHLSQDGEKAVLDLKAHLATNKGLTEKIEETKKRLEAANNAARPQAEERRTLEEEMNAASIYKQEVKSQLQALRQIKASPVKEFTIATPASWTGSAKTSFKKLFAGVFFALCLVLAAPVFAGEYYFSRESPADETARLFGLPLLSRGTFSSRLKRKKTGELTLSRMSGEDGEDSLRLLALRIQQSLRRPGAIIVFTPLEHEESPISLICKLAVCFAEREELVLVLDAGATLAESRSILATLFHGTPHRTAEGAPLDPTLVDEGSGSHMATFGVSDFLCHEELEMGDLVLHTKFTRVDCIHGGVCPPPREGMASRRMSELLEQSRGRYSMILVAGPSTNSQTDVQLLAARADGMLFTVSPNTPISSRGHEVIQDLIDLDAPVMGLIG